MSPDELTALLSQAQETIRVLEAEVAEMQRRVGELQEQLTEPSIHALFLAQQLQVAKWVTIGELAAGIAHELNNPLTTISLCTESLLTQAPGGDPKRPELKIIEKEVERLAHLIANLSRLSRGGPPQMAVVDVQAALDNTLELIRYLLQKHHIEVIPSFLPRQVLVLADPQQLQQLFLDLFTNAVDAMTDGGSLFPEVREADELGRGRSGTPLSPDAAPAVIIEIADTGAGIAPEILPRVMEPFFTTKAEGKGTGLGLAVCRRIVQEHQGALEIESQVGQGTLVRVTLPGVGRPDDLKWGKTIWSE